MNKLERDVAALRPRERVRISDVSEALGLTKSTVSRALNGYPDIAEATRVRVRQMAQKMGYSPLSHAQAIRTGQIKSLGFVVQLADHDEQRPFLAAFLSGLSQGASAEGWTLTISTTTSVEATMDTYQTMMRDRKVDGFILHRTMLDDARVELLRCENMPFVLFGRYPDPTDCAWFDILGEKAMSDAVQHLARLGHRSIGFINGGTQYNYAPLRRGGFLDGMQAAGIMPRGDLMREGAVTSAQGYEIAKEMLQNSHPPTAIVCAVDMAAIGVYRAATELGLTMGHDLSVIAYDGAPEGAHVKPGLSTFAVNFAGAGRQLSHLLIRRICGADPRSLRQTVEADFIDRGSANPPEVTSKELAQKISTLRGQHK